MTGEGSELEKEHKSEGKLSTKLWRENDRATCEILSFGDPLFDVDIRWILHSGKKKGRDTYGVNTGIMIQKFTLSRLKLATFELQFCEIQKTLDTKMLQANVL